ncbi:Probable LRR receptor-like serine/threonine-protein kinase At3g47570 [Linum grandiflorum]
MISGSLSVYTMVTTAFLVQLLCLCRWTSSSGSLLSNETDRLALLSFKSMITSDPLEALSSWNDSTHFCKWYGVSCSRRHYGRVTALELHSQGLSGSISTQVGNLSFLKLLRLYNNSFVGGIPSEIGRLGRLQKLGLSNNLFDGEVPSAIFNLSSLTEMWFGFNQFHGILPWNLGLLLPNLELFDVASNQFNGNVPLSLSNASNLVNIQLAVNNFTGNMPSMEVSNKLTWFSIFDNSLGSGKANDLNFLSSLTNATSLRLVEIDQNNFGGSLSQDIGNLSTTLTVLSFGDNNIYGNISTGIQYLVNLEELWVYNNNLSGNIPSSLGSCISLESLYLQDNLLQGGIPSSLSSLRAIQELDLSFNDLFGQIPKFLELMNISGLLNLSNNNFDGEVPTQGIFKNSSIFSVIGNDKLCGGIAELKLLQCNFTVHSNKPLSLKWKIVISTIFSLLFLAFIASIFFILWIKKRRRHDTVSIEDKNLLKLSYQRLFKAIDGFSLSNQIGVGSFGTVYKGILDDISEASINIAVKVFNLQRRGASKSFMVECEALKNIRHKNLVKIVTVCSSVDHEGNDFKALIYNFLANGSLEDWLHRPIQSVDESRTRSLNFINRLNVAIDIASAVDYLHNNCGTPIVHCDLKPSNVLLDEDMVAHVGDFGLARFLFMVENPASSTIGIKGTVGYAPPEYGMENKVSIQGDVYSYGILLLELFIGKRPTEETFRDGLNLHNVVMSAFSEQRTFEVVDPVLLNELLRRLTSHHNNTSNSLDEARKDLEELMSSILEIGVSPRRED